MVVQLILFEMCKRLNVNTLYVCIVIELYFHVKDGLVKKES